MTQASRSLWVCWTTPGVQSREDLPILSFLSPCEENDLLHTYPGAVIPAREASRAIRAEAKEMYVNLVARIGTSLTRDGVTFRQALAGSGQASQWWYHPVADKDCESDRAFDWIIAVMTIRAVAEKHGRDHVVLFSAPPEVAAVLKSAFTVEERRPLRPRRASWAWIRGLASRVRYAFTALRQWVALRRQPKIGKGPFHIVLSGFWDWSVWWDDNAGSLADRYLKRLPDELKQQGLTSVGWFAWLDPHSEPGKGGRRLRDVLAPLRGCENVVILQELLRPSDVFRSLSDFQPLVTFLKIRGRSGFKEVFRHKGLDYYPLFAHQLLRGFLSSSLPHCGLVALATDRACRCYDTRVTLSFLEHFPYSRAHYEGARRAGNGIIDCLAVQHASYSQEKTFLFLHPTLEFRGEPDGCAVPTPDTVFVMGAFGRDLFLECGYPPEHVAVTGSPRYDHVGPVSVDHPGYSDQMSPSLEAFSREERVRMESEIGKETKILMVSGLDIEAELHMVDAVYTAARNIAGVELLFRNHPFRKIQRHPRFAAYDGAIQLTRGSLEEDLSRADVVIFTYTTVAEEAFLQGKPVWQWLPLGFNGSALVEVVTIRQFGSVARLREAFQDFGTDPRRFLSSTRERQAALERLFYRGDGGAARRVAAAVAKQAKLTYKPTHPIA